MLGDDPKKCFEQIIFLELADLESGRLGDLSLEQHLIISVFIIFNILFLNHFVLYYCVFNGYKLNCRFIEYIILMINLYMILE